MQSDPLPLCHLNGRLQPLAAAAISPLDRGFLFGDGVYEMMKVLGGVPLFLDRHLTRLTASLAGVAIPEPPGLHAAIAELLAATSPYDGSLYLQVTRGAAPVRGHRPAADLTPTLFLMPARLDFPVPADAPGWQVITRPDPRWQRCDLKTTSLIGSVLGSLEAEKAGADEIVWTGVEGELREGGHTNIFVRRGDRLATHTRGTRILPGVTRALLLELAAEAGFLVEERRPRLAERSAWQEVFVCGTLTGVRGVTRLDDKPIADGEVGPWTRQLALALAEREQREAATAAPAAPA